jgi:hypothetical protein
MCLVNPLSITPNVPYSSRGACWCCIFYVHIAIGHRIDFGYEYIEKVLKMHAHAVLEIVPWTSPAC